MHQHASSMMQVIIRILVIYLFIVMGIGTGICIGYLRYPVEQKHLYWERLTDLEWPR